MKLRIVFLVFSLTGSSQACKGDSEKSSEPKPVEATPSKSPAELPQENAAQTPDVPWRVGFALDSAKKDVFIPRPSKPEKGTAIKSFVARRAKDLATWERLELELANGTTETLAAIDSTHSYEFRQHPQAGVDLAVIAADGTSVQTIGPLRRAHLYTKALAEEAPRVDGKASLVIRQGDTRIELTPSELANLGQARDETTEQDAWNLLTILTKNATVGSAETLVAFAPGESRTYEMSDLTSGKTKLLLRHNGRGELRLKAVSGASEDKDAGLRNLAKIELR